MAGGAGFFPREFYIPFPMKVVHINKADTGGGAAVAMCRIHAALRKEGVDSSILVEQVRSASQNAFSTSTSAADRAADFAHFVFERLRILPHERYSSMRFNFSLASDGRDVSSLPVVREADVIHLHWVNQGFLSMESLQSLAALGKPIVWTLHDMWPFTGGCHYAGTCLEFNEHCGFCPFLRDPGKDDLSARLFKLKKETYQKMNISVVACSQWLGTLASSSSLFHKRKTVAIPNPIDTSVFRPLDKARCRAQLGLPTDKKLILFGAAKVSDIRKGYRYLVEALRIIANSFPSVASHTELVVFGEMDNEIKDFGIEFNVHSMNFISSTDRLVQLYNAADAFVLPSLQDNLPNTVVESLACGTPVVGFRNCGVPEMVVHGKTGYLAEPKNSLSLANGIYATLFFDADKKRDEVVNHAKSLFGEHAVAQKYIDVYNNALSSNGSR